MMLKILVVGGSLGLHSVDVILSGQSLGRDIYNVRDDIIDDDGHSDQASLSESGGEEQKLLFVCC